MRERVLFCHILLAVISDTAFATASACNTGSVTCSHDGSYGYVDMSGISYNSGTGMFTGSLITNLCPNFKYSNYSYSGTAYTTQGLAKAACTTANLRQYAAPTSAPLRSAFGYTVGGQNIYGPMDNGFSSGQVCSAGSCVSGTDVNVCFVQLALQCGTSFNPTMGLDLCGGHADPYHNHYDPVCMYDRNATGHSPLIGFALDGRGIYGYKESSYSYPTDLDWCGGHYGNVPATTVNGVTFPAANNVYHYHMQPNAPFGLGCYGPVTSLSACQALYPTCLTGYTTLQGQDSSGNTCSYSYDTDCPCFGSSLTYSYNQMCGVATTQTAAVTFTAWSSSSSSSSDSSLSTGAIAGIVVGSIVGLVAIVGVTAFMCKSAKKAKNRKVVKTTHYEETTTYEDEVKDDVPTTNVQ